MEKTEIHAVEDKTDNLYAFFEKNRKVLFRSVAAVLIFAVVLIVVLLVNDMTRKNETAKLDLLIERYDKAKEALSAVNVDTDSGGTIIQADAETLLDDLRALGENAHGYPAARAWFMAADICHERKEWREAEAAWLAAAEKGRGTHLAPISLFNAAVANEELEDTEAALINYRKSLDFDSFPAAARAQFSVGRLEEKNGDTEAAIAAYRTVIEKWPSDTDWTNLARSRILTLEAGQTK